MKLTVEVAFQIGQSVWLKTDPSQLEHLVIGINILPKGILYRICLGNEITDHYDFELSLTADENKKLDIPGETN